MKSISRLTALLVLLALFLSACGGATPPAAPAAEAPTVAPAAEAPTAAPAAEAPTVAPAAEAPTAAPAAGAEKVKVTWWTENAEQPLQDALKRDFVDTFNAAHPNIELEITFKDQLDQVLRTAIQGVAAPDINQTPGPASAFEHVGGVHILHLDQSSAKYGWKDKIFPWAIDVGKLEGKLYSLPLTYETMVLWYNKKTFADNGWQPPKNRAELEKIAEEA